MKKRPVSSNQKEQEAPLKPLLLGEYSSQLHSSFETFTCKKFKTYPELNSQKNLKKIAKNGGKTVEKKVGKREKEKD